MAYHHGDLRAALLAAVEDSFREGGLAQISLRDVARRAQVSHAAPAHHFGNRQGLLSAFAAQGFDRLADMMVEAAEGREAGADRLAGAGRGYLRFALGHRAHFTVMFDLRDTDPDHPDLRRARDRAYGALVAAVQQCLAEGRLQPGQADAATAAAWSLVHGFATLWNSGSLQDRATVSPESSAAAALALGEATVGLFVQRLLQT